MRKQDISFLLLFLMLITPIASAFEHCAGMDTSGHSSVSQKNSVLSSAGDTVQLEHKTMLNELQNNQTNIDCHNSNSCTFHVCGVYSITSSSPIINAVSPSCYSSFEYASFDSTVSSSDLRPPIFTL